MKDRINIINDTLIFFDKPIVEFDKNLLVLDVVVSGFTVYIQFSVDKLNWTAPVPIEELSNLSIIDIAEFNELISSDAVFVCLKFEKITAEIEHTLLQQNTEHVRYALVGDIIYDNEIVSHKSTTEYELVNKLPSWNLYDNQRVAVDRWLVQCQSIAQMYGHFAVYFKSKVTKQNNTLSTNTDREIVSIKRLPIMFPNNELPQNRNQSMDWDYPIIDEVIIHVVTSIFKNAFGTKPEIGDFLYVPIVNKLFKVNSVQSKVGFMGAVGWWEVFLGKYEQDSSTIMNKDLFSQFNDSLSNFDNLEVYEEFNEIIENDVLTKEKVQESTIDEKKKATQNFTNKLVDSSTYIDLKETDLQREFYSKRLEIVSINPDTNSFPVTMYDCTKLERNTVGISYNLKNAVSINKHSLISRKQYSITFNFVLLKRYSGTIFELTGFQIDVDKNKLSLFDSNSQERFDINYDINYEEFYQMRIEFKENKYNVTICIMKNKHKKIVFQNVYISKPKQLIKFDDLCLMGGNFYINDIIFEIDNNIIISDYTNPILNMMNI